MPQLKPSTILIAEDDDDDFLLTEQALREARLLNPLQRVVDGQELMDYLTRREPIAGCSLLHR